MEHDRLLIVYVNELRCVGSFVRIDYRELPSPVEDAEPLRKETPVACGEVGCSHRLANWE